MNRMGLKFFYSFPTDPVSFLSIYLAKLGKIAINEIWKVWRAWNPNGFMFHPRSQKWQEKAMTAYQWWSSYVWCKCGCYVPYGRSWKKDMREGICDPSMMRLCLKLGSLVEYGMSFPSHTCPLTILNLSAPLPSPYPPRESLHFWLACPTHIIYTCIFRDVGIQQVFKVEKGRGGYMTYVLWSRRSNVFQLI